MSSQNSPLLSLPPELRNNVYEMAPTVRETIDIVNDPKPALLASCSLIRQEASKLYYACNHFLLIVEPNNMQAVASSLYLIGRDNTSLIRELALQIDGSVAANCFFTARGRAEVRFQPPEAWDEAARYVLDGTGIAVGSVTCAAMDPRKASMFGQTHLRRYLDLPFFLYLAVRGRLAYQGEADMSEALQRVSVCLMEEAKGAVDMRTALAVGQSKDE
ncbi:hypothetical protein LTR36_006910 [Oleoguttula mirabilis]|uniref:Uncharacterized protein n=1 Tax=Oleoguttula mirabilis TaxID=1507867 RepID=A0AAV9JB72_9PEZI|nr:hypothetical protein LTR36_006910 [Oleoguttula mirabilis]